MALKPKSGCATICSKPSNSPESSPCPTRPYVAYFHHITERTFYAPLIHISAASLTSFLFL